MSLKSNGENGESARGTEPPRISRREDIADMIQWALLAAAITLVFGLVLNVLEAVL